MMSFRRQRDPRYNSIVFKSKLKFGGRNKKQAEEVFVSSIVAVVFFRSEWK